MSPTLATVEVAVGTDSNESTGVETRGGPVPRESADPGAELGGGLVGRELPSGETVVGAVSPRRGERPAASKRGPTIQSRRHDGRSPAGADAHSAEIQRRSASTIWADVGGGASGERRRPRDRSRDIAALDAR